MEAGAMAEPADSVLATQEKVSRLEAAIAVLGVGVRLDSCAQFVERARRRFAKVEEEFNCVQEERVQRAEFAEGLARLESLRAEAAVLGAPWCNPNPPFRRSSGRGRHVKSGHCSEEKPDSCATHSDGLLMHELCGEVVLSG